MTSTGRKNQRPYSSKLPSSSAATFRPFKSSIKVLISESTNSFKMPPKTMRAVVFKEPYKVAVEDRPVPTLKNPTDAILRVTSTALCGSDLHFYRGHLKCPTDFICGHEFVGEIVEKGDAVSKFKVGDRVVVPFYTACGECCKSFIPLDNTYMKCGDVDEDIEQITASAAKHPAAPKANSSATPLPPTQSMEVRPSTFDAPWQTPHSSRSRREFPKRCSSSWQISSPLATSPPLGSSKTSHPATRKNSQSSVWDVDPWESAPSRVR